MNSHELHETVQALNDMLAMGELKGIGSIETSDFDTSAFIQVRTEQAVYRRAPGSDSEVMDAISKRFPGGRVQRLGLANGQDRRALHVDRARYQVDIGPVLLTLHYFVKHECVDYIGRASTGGKPKWWCGGCKKPVTTTKAREIGLLPKLVRKGAK